MVWPYAARCYSTVYKMTQAEGAGSPFASRHGGNGFTGPAIAFGALVHAMPGALRKKRNLKFEPALRPVVVFTFLGCMMQDGGSWLSEFMMAFVEDLADKPFWSRSMWPECRVAAHSRRELALSMRAEGVYMMTLPCI